MKKTLLPAITAIFAIGIFIGMIGCGENDEAEEPAMILKTDPISGGEIFTNSDLVITFDKTMTMVKVNGFPADIIGAEATWTVLALETGEQTLKIEWIDVNGNSGSEDIIFIVKELDSIICFRLKGGKRESWLYADGTA